MPSSETDSETEVETKLPAGARKRTDAPAKSPEAGSSPKLPVPPAGQPLIKPKTILVSNGDDAKSVEMASYVEADASVLKFVAGALNAERLTLHVVVVFQDLFVWRSSLSVGTEDATLKDFVQRAIQADWEFNAGVRPHWWPADREAERIWGVHYREDRDNGRAELARMRLERYDLSPIQLTPLPARDSPST
jgi:hypothetical protein